METVDNIQRLVIEELRENYREGVSTDDCKLPVVLTKINQKYGVKFVVIIDEWDAIFRENNLHLCAIHHIDLNALQNPYILQS